MTGGCIISKEVSKGDYHIVAGRKIGMPSLYPENGHVPNGSLPPKHLKELVSAFVRASSPNLGYKEFITIINASNHNSGDFLRRIRLALDEQGRPAAATLVSTNDHHYGGEVLHAVLGYPEADYKRRAVIRDWRREEDRYLLTHPDNGNTVVFAALEAEIDLLATYEIAEHAGMLVLAESGAQLGDFPLEWLPEGLPTFQFLPYDDRLKPLNTGDAAEDVVKTLAGSHAWTSAIMVQDALIEAQQLDAIAATNG